AHAAHTQHTPKDFTLNLRLPGQYFDAETGWHDNVLRTYDPQRAQYLEPDPLGPLPNWRSTRLLTQPYAYANHNPITYADPTGLILFAFDGTGNSNDLTDPAMVGGTVSNVWEFRNLYDDGNARYITGVGTVHRDAEYRDIVPDEFARGRLLDYLTGSDPLYLNDMGGNYSGPARIDRMELYIRDEADLFDNTKAMDIDIIGFSRGAAQARDFANRITQASIVIDGKTYYQYKDKNGQDACQWVNFRFMGLWDTVLSTNFSGTRYNLGIPTQFQHVAHAVALNEHRSGNLLSYATRLALPYSQHWGAFPLVSIGQSSNNGDKVRLELGFLGAHADIGGGYDSNDLSKVSLAWMINQAKQAGVQMSPESITVSGTAMLHDKSNNIQTGQPRDTCFICTAGEDREVVGAPSGSRQREMGFGGTNSMTYADTQGNGFITYKNRADIPRWTEEQVARTPGIGEGEVDRFSSDETGEVNMDAYLAWLKLNGYNLDNLR
ncbi:hypothetical protein GTZ97_16390, partial [Aquabacterium fontiphilum]|uniref:phospholipase effector Tle1 domain-containing protein n=1 Tax=Aquabacterium fontiphilum TaxID=450365 RepID=UPI00191BEC4D